MSKKNKTQNKYGVYVAATELQSVESISELILDIVNSSAGDSVKIAALDTIKKAFSNTISVANSNFDFTERNVL